MMIALVICIVLVPVLMLWAKRLSDKDNYACYLAAFSAIAAFVIALAIAIFLIIRSALAC